MSRIRHSRAQHRSGKIALITGLLLVVLIGAMACALDLGYITMTKTQLRAATDSGALAGGTEFLPGLGASATLTPAEIDPLVRAQAVSFAGANRAGELSGVFVDSTRDIALGTGQMDPATGIWSFTWGATPYNAVRVTAHRDVVNSTNGDGPLPLFFARVIGQNVSNVNVFSTAVILPASGIRIPPGSGVGTGLSPFAYEVRRWQKYWRAVDYFINTLGSDPSLINENIMDNGPGGDGTELFFEWVPPGQGGGNGNNLVLRQMFGDAYQVVDPAADIVAPGPDGVLEQSIYPISNEPGNFGTVDIGHLGNSTNDLKRQIEFGPNEQDLATFANNTIAPSPGSPLTLQGDTGISAGIENTIESIIGQCRAILLYDSVSNPGNNAEYIIVDMVGTRWMHVDFSGSDKVLILQPCSYSDPAGIPDFDDTIDGNTTVFTPLILAQ